MDQLYREIGRALRKRRETAGLTQEVVAQRVGLSRTSITNIEQGRQHVSLHVLYALADAMGAKPGDLLPDPSTLVERDEALARSLEEQPVELDDETKDWVQRLVKKTQG